MSAHRAGEIGPASRGVWQRRPGRSRQHGSQGHGGQASAGPTEGDEGRVFRVRRGGESGSLLG